MVMIKRHLLFLFSLLQNFNSVLSDADNLRLVHVVYRHGDRSPTKTFPTDPYQENDWPQGFGQLSTTGMRQHHDLGEMLRQRYGNGFLNDSYSRYQIHVRSTDMDRTLMSAESQLSGLYPPSGEQLWNPDIAWQPIPVHTVPYDTDTMLNTGTHCKAYDKLQDEARKSDDFKNLEQQYQETLTVTGRESGLNTSDMVTVWSAVPNTLYCESVSGKTLPDWVSSQIYDDLQYLNAMDFHFKNYNDQMKKLRAGVFLNELLNHTQQKVEGKMDDRMRMFMYSAHDTTVAAILSALGLYPDGCYPPTYASIIMFELGEPTQGNFEMKIYFKNDTIDDPSRQPETPLTLPGCQESCPVNDFVRLVEPMTMTAEEQKNVCDEKEDEGLSAVVMGMFVVLFLLIVGLLLLAVAMCLKKRRNSGYQAANFGSAPYG